MVVEEYWANGGFTRIKNQRTSDSILHQEIIDSSTLNIAFLNLKKVCCEHKEFSRINPNSCNNDKAHFYDNVPQSYYLFDHLLDLYLRRLDGDPNAIYGGATLDETGQERRERSDETIEKIEGTAPRVIDTKYREFRTIDSKNLLEGVAQDTSKSRNDYINNMNSEQNLEIINNYSERTLGEKYTNACNVVGYTYFLFQTSENLVSISDTKAMLLNSNSCPTLIHQRINAETYHVMQMSIQKGNTLLTDNVKEFANTYLNKRLLDLQTLLQKSQTSLTRVVRATSKLIPQCT